MLQVLYSYTTCNKINHLLHTQRLGKYDSNISNKISLLNTQIAQINFKIFKQIFKLNCNFSIKSQFLNKFKSLDATESRTKLIWNFRILICHGSPSAVFRELKNGRELFPHFWNLSISKFGRIIGHVLIKSLRSSTKTNQNYNVMIYTGFYKRRLLPYTEIYEKL